MGDRDEKASETTRRESLGALARLSIVQGDDDDYDLHAMGVADGFRPVRAPQARSSSPPNTTSRDAPTRQVPPPRPSSVTKPHRRDGSFSLQHDGLAAEPDADGRPGGTSSAPATSPFVDPETPYEGPSGPSHPYQMYPQNVRVARTGSIATTLSAPVSEASYNGPRGPAHPYGMYPQSTVPGAGSTSDRTAQDEIGVGFPGTTDNYQRRIGPDGEDVADMIGPDGHTEQLPPYTRYPEEAYQRKAMGVESPQPAPAESLQSLPAQPTLAIPGAGGIGIATRNPEFASTEDLHSINSPQSRQSVQSFTTDSSTRTITTGTTELNEKKSRKEWQTTAKRRVWGIVPCWAIVLAGIVLVLMGVVLGAVIGTELSPHGKKPPHPDSPSLPDISPNWDTQPLTTLPPDLPPLQTGTYAMPLMNNRISNTCFSDSTLARAWDCNLAFVQLSMTIEKLVGQPNTSDYSLTFDHNETHGLESYVYAYGVQPPILTDMTLELVTDIFEAPRGPAWNLNAIYNKTIILPEGHLTPSDPSSSSSDYKRRMLFGGVDFKRRSIAQPGDKPWICQWDNTILEVFIYAGQNNSFSRPMDPWPSTSMPTPTASGTGAPASMYTAEYTGLSSSTTTLEHGSEENPTSTTAADGDSTATAISSPAPSSSDWFGKDPPMPAYPRVIKVEERRGPVTGEAKPYCQQFMIVGENQEATLVLSDDGKPIEVEIVEEEKYFDEQLARNAFENLIGARSGSKSGSEMSDCGCMWWLT
ncbi:hypothetical protein GGR52DRAFT_503728 [Hypoxylon sp. FL1284]|nr:hypothetical protein GGR52DRAFT_503728 [Hypoxylon sp. FL1284]